jgi:UDP-glucose 4-epimerase
MRYFITGGAGFIGSHLTRHLLKQGHDVTVLDNFSSKRHNRLSQTKACIVEGSVLDMELVESIAQNCDQIIHLAAVVGVRLAIEKGLLGLEIGYNGTKNVLEAALKHDREVFIASSSAIYGKITELPVHEDSDCLLGSSRNANWLYSVTKLTEEHLAMAYYREMGVKVKIGRFFNVIGPYQVSTYGMVVPTFITRALKGEPLLVYGDGKQTRTFVYIDDAIKGVETVLSRGKTGLVYNIGGTEEIFILDLAERIKALTGSASSIKLMPYSKAFYTDFEETRRRVPDIARLVQLGYKPRFSLDEALMRIISHHREQEG